MPSACRILAVACAFDAMTSDRPYRKQLSHAAALREIRRCTGTQFDPAVVEVFLKVVRPLP
ncbi:MAG: HD-GYP domain-containing protein [Bacillota bacterium]